MRPVVVHHHGFKCAGSSVVHVLHRNWPERVLHVEHRQPDRRIGVAAVAPLLVRTELVAVTSHLLTMPAYADRLAPVHFALVRDPLQRLRSAWQFVGQQQRWRDGGFDGFLAALEHQASNFHVRLLGVPGDAAADWPCDPARVPLGEPHVLIGLVERFDESMFLLERRLSALGCAFDGSVARRHNVGAPGSFELPPAMVDELRERNRADFALHERVGAAMDAELARVDPDGSGLADHRRRCAERARSPNPFLGLEPARWTYLDG